MARKLYCYDCGKKLNWLNERRCKDCHKKLCSNCEIILQRQGENFSYCVKCAIGVLQKRQEELDKNIICSKCGNESPRVDCIYCPFCRHPLKEDKTIKSEKNKEK